MQFHTTIKPLGQAYLLVTALHSVEITTLSTFWFLARLLWQPARKTTCMASVPVLAWHSAAKHFNSISIELVKGVNSCLGKHNFQS